MLVSTNDGLVSTNRQWTFKQVSSKIIKVISKDAPKRVTLQLDDLEIDMKTERKSYESIGNPNYRIRN